MLSDLSYQFLDLNRIELDIVLYFKELHGCENSWNALKSFVCKYNVIKQRVVPSFSTNSILHFQYLRVFWARI